MLLKMSSATTRGQGETRPWQRQKKEVHGRISVTKEVDPYQRNRERDPPQKSHGSGDERKSYKDPHPSSAAQRPLDKTSRIIAIDPNRKNLGYGVDNEGNAILIDIPRWHKKLRQRVRELDKETREVSKKFGGGSEKARVAKRRLERAKKDLTDRVSRFLRMVAVGLVERYDVVGLGDSSGGSSPPKSGDLTQEFTVALRRATRESGRRFMLWSEFESTSRCHYCGNVANKLTPDIRVWRCQRCAKTHLRDENAAVNGLVWMMNRMRGKTGTIQKPVAAKKRLRWFVSNEKLTETKYDAKLPIPPLRHLIFRVLNECLRVLGNFNQRVGQAEIHVEERTRPNLRQREGA